MQNNMNRGPVVGQAIDDAYSHAANEEFGYGNWKGEKHQKDTDGVKVSVGGVYHPLYPDRDVKLARITDESGPFTEEHYVSQAAYTDLKGARTGGLVVKHLMGINSPLDGSEDKKGPAGVRYNYDDSYDENGESSSGPHVRASFSRSADGVNVYRKGPNGERGAVKRLTGKRALRAQEIMQDRATRRIRESVDEARKGDLVGSSR